MPDEEQFYSRIEQGLTGYPGLRSFLPTGYPRTGRSRVDRERALNFEEKRTGRFAHNINLPLALYLVGYEEAVAGARSFARQMLQDIEAFVTAYRSTPRVRQVIEPLRTDPWDRSDPKMWSVVAHAWMSTQWQIRGASILAFEAPIGIGGRTADIHFRRENQDYLLDLEVWNAVTGTTAEGIRLEGMRRAEAKAEQKFADLPQSTLGMVAEFCFAVDDPFEQIVINQHILSAFPVGGMERCWGQLFLVRGIGDGTGQIQGYEFADAESIRRPLLPRSAR